MQCWFVLHALAGMKERQVRPELPWNHDDLITWYTMNNQCILQFHWLPHENNELTHFLLNSLHKGQSLVNNVLALFCRDTLFLPRLVPYEALLYWNLEVCVPQLTFKREQEFDIRKS